MPPDRPFDTRILHEARTLANRYAVALRYSEECRNYEGQGVELPLVLGVGKTPDECLAATRELLVTVVAHMLEQGQNPPIPAVENVRSEQINVRVSVAEKRRLEQKARDQGFRGVADFMRKAALT